MNNIPTPTGEYAVGTFTYTVKDVREEIMAPGTMRSVAARVYYPVDKESVKDLKPSVGLSETMAKAISKVFKIPINYEKLKNEGRIYSNCYENAKRIEGKRFPLIMFHHGMASYREGNSFLCIDLASHGYVVICVSHSMEAACSEFDDGNKIYFDKSILKKQYQPFFKGCINILKLNKFEGSDKEMADKFDEFQRVYSKFLMSRPDEWVLDNDAALLYAKENLSDLIDFEKGIGVSGHSMGGNVAYKLCCEKDEYVCGINIDGGLFGDYTESVLNKPFMQVSCKSNERIVARVYVRHTKPVFKALFRDMQHMGFSDMKHMLKPGLTSGKLDPDLMHENLCRCHLEIFDTYLKGLKDEPDLKTNDVISVTKYEADM